MNKFIFLFILIIQTNSIICNNLTLQKNNNIDFVISLDHKSLLEVMNILIKKNILFVENIKRENHLLLQELKILDKNKFEAILKHNLINYQKLDGDEEKLRRLNSVLSTEIKKFDENTLNEIKKRTFNQDGDIENIIILYGPSGNGKTTFVKKFAEATKSELFELDGGCIIGPYENEGAKELHKEFLKAHNFVLNNNKRVVIFIDEIDKLTKKGIEKNGSSESKATATLWKNIDKYKNCNEIIVILATNHLEDVHPNIKKRSSLKVEFSNPDDQMRKELILYFINKFKLNFEETNLQKKLIIIERIKNNTKNLSNRDIEEIFMAARRKSIKGFITESILDDEIAKQKKYNLEKKIKFKFIMKFINNYGATSAALCSTLAIAWYIKQFKKGNKNKQSNNCKDNNNTDTTKNTCVASAA